MVKASGSCGLQITSVKYWDVFIYYINAFFSLFWLFVCLFVFGVSCSASFAVRFVKGIGRGKKSERMKENSGSPLPATAVG